jgi:hypothetical protein
MINYAAYYFYIDKNDDKAISILKKVIDRAALDNIGQSHQFH